MGLMDKLFGGLDTSASNFTTQEAFAGILLGASACDGHIAEDEVAGLVTCLLRMKLYHRFTDKQIQPNVEQAPRGRETQRRRRSSGCLLQGVAC